MAGLGRKQGPACPQAPEPRVHGQKMWPKQAEKPEGQSCHKLVLPKRPWKTDLSLSHLRNEENGHLHLTETVSLKGDSKMARTQARLS